MCVCTMYVYVWKRWGEGGWAAMTLEKEMDEILWMEEEGSGFGKEQLRSFCC